MARTRRTRIRTHARDDDHSPLYKILDGILEINALHLRPTFQLRNTSS